MDKFFRLPFAVTGDKTTVPDAAQPTGSVSYAEGFGPDYEADPGTDPDAKDVPRDETNQLFYDVTNAIREIQSFGTPDFITSALNGGTPFSYEQGARVKWSDGNVYESRINSNTTDPSNTANWGILNPLGFTANLATNGILRFPMFDASNQLRIVLIQFGTWTSSPTPGNPVSVTFNTPFPTTRIAMAAICFSASTSVQSAWADSPTNLGFNGKCSAASVACNYIAIGY